MSIDEHTLREHIAREMGHIDYGDLAPHLGRVVKIAPRLDFVEAAVAVCRDDARKVARWAKEGLVSRVSEDDLREWHRRRPRFLALVTSPWVLVQEVLD